MTRHGNIMNQIDYSVVCYGIAEEKSLRKSVEKKISAWVEEHVTETELQLTSVGVTFEKGNHGHQVSCTIELNFKQQALWGLGLGSNALDALSKSLKTIHVTAHQAYRTTLNAEAIHVASR